MLTLENCILQGKLTTGKTKTSKMLIEEICNYTGYLRGVLSSQAWHEIKTMNISSGAYGGVTEKTIII